MIVRVSIAVLIAVLHYKLIPLLLISCKLTSPAGFPPVIWTARSRGRQRNMLIPTIRVAATGARRRLTFPLVVDGLTFMLADD